MDISESGLAFIEREEGCVRHVYRDSRGIDTVGVGHVVLPGESFPGAVSDETIAALLHHDVQKCVAAIAANVKVELTQNQFDALVSWMFNCGVGAFLKSTLLVKLNAGDYAGAADEFLQWRRAGSNPTALLARRQRERALFLTP
jgi:lysozyme